VRTMSHERITWRQARPDALIGSSGGKDHVAVYLLGAEWVFAIKGKGERPFPASPSVAAALDAAERELAKGTAGPYSAAR
jgi:hypothetical protein